MTGAEVALIAAAATEAAAAGTAAAGATAAGATAAGAGAGLGAGAAGLGAGLGAGAGGAVGAGMLAAPLTAAEMAAPMLAEAATPMLMEPMLMASQAPSAATLTGESLAAMQPSLLNPATGSSYFGMEGQTPFFTEQLKAATALPGESGGGMMQGGGTSSMFGSGQGVMPQGLSTSPTPSSFGLKMPSMRGMNSASKMMGGEQQQQAPAAQRMPSQAPQSQAEIMQRLKMLQGGRSNFAGLLGQAIGGY